MATLEGKKGPSVRNGVRAAREAQGWGSLPLTHLPAGNHCPHPGGWPSLGTGPLEWEGSIPGAPSFDWPLNSLWIGISTTFLPQGRGLASTVLSGPAMQHLSCEGWEPNPGVYLRTPQWEAAGMAGDLRGSDWGGLGHLWAGTYNQGPAPAPAPRAQPTSRPRSWQSAGTVRGRSPSGCARPG